jgi:putative flippase GtrA
MPEGYFKLPEKIRMVNAAAAGALIGWITYEIIYLLNPQSVYRATSSWLLGFLVGVVRQHALHRYFTFAEKTPYWKSLWKAYAFYTVSAVIGSIVNFMLTEVVHVHHQIAWLACLLITASISLFGLKKAVFSDTRPRPGDGPS